MMKFSRKTARTALLVTGCALTLTVTAHAQQITGTPGSPGATTTIPGNQLPPPDPRFGGVIKDDALASKPWWAPRVVPPKGAPNVLLIITDDAGFGVPGTFGGVIPTPTMDRIANEGLRYNRVFSTALCSPTRAALITGRNHHSRRIRRHLGTVHRLPWLQQHHRQGQGDDRAHPARQWLRNVVVRQGSQHAGFRREPGWAVRPMADRHGLRILLWLRGR